MAQVTGNRLTLDQIYSFMQELAADAITAQAEVLTAQAAGEQASAQTQRLARINALELLDATKDTIYL